jgi:hypothetical protein
LSDLADSDRIHDPKRAMIDTDDMSKGRNLSLAGNAHEPHVDVHKHISDVAGSCPFPVASGLLARWVSSPCRQVGGRLSKSHPNDYDYQKRDPDDGDDGIGGTPGGPTRDFGGRRFPVVGGKFITLVDHYWACLPHRALILSIPYRPYLMPPKAARGWLLV